MLTSSAEAPPSLHSADQGHGAPAASPPDSATFVIRLPADAKPFALNVLFGRHGPLEVDVGCGKGRFLIAKAKANPDKNFLGIDRRMKRIQKVDRKLQREGLANVRLILAEAYGVVDSRLPPQSVAAFYVFFSDPWPKRRHHGRRLFGPMFLDGLARALMPGGSVHVATDHLDYFGEIRKALAQDRRFAETTPYETREDERTEFELTFMKMGAPIGRCSFRKVAQPPAPTDAPPPPLP